MNILLIFFIIGAILGVILSIHLRHLDYAYMGDFGEKSLSHFFFGEIPFYLGLPIIGGVLFVIFSLVISCVALYIPGPTTLNEIQTEELIALSNTNDYYVYESLSSSDTVYYKYVHSEDGDLKLELESAKDVEIIYSNEEKPTLITYEVIFDNPVHDFIANNYAFVRHHKYKIIISEDNILIDYAKILQSKVD